MIKGIGIDIIEIERVEAAVKKYGEKFLRRVFTKREIEHCTSHKAYRYPELAVRFAAKEAYSKALGTGIGGFGRRHTGITWREIEVINDQRGKPLLVIRGKVSKKAHVSLSHSQANAVASVYVEK
ncbi:MAG TPA: holo-ACP synthase [Candidatus Sulfotelmatobacter sp.]|nr:holo-ACP synthase [Candidatus Sulfotelmatobacter sp.]